MPLVHLMFPKYSSRIQVSPFLTKWLSWSRFTHLLSIFFLHSCIRFARLPPFYQYYEDTKTAFALLRTFGFPRYRIPLRLHLILSALYGGGVYHISLGRLWVGLFPFNPISCGDVRLSRVPVCPLSAFDVFLDPGRISPARL